MPIPTRILGINHRLRKFNQQLSLLGLKVLSPETPAQYWQKVFDGDTALSGYYWQTDVSNTPFQYTAHELRMKPKTWIGPFKTKAECQAHIDGQTHLEEDFS